MYYVLLVLSRNLKLSSSPEVKTTHDLGMASEGPSCSTSLPQGHNPAYASTEEPPIQPNPCYVVVN